MTKITQKQLIGQIKQFNEIKPRKEWVVLLKSQILAEKQEAIIKAASAKNAGILGVLSFVFAPKKLAYVTTVAFFLIVGVFGFARYTVPGDLLFPMKKIAEQSQAALTGQSELRTKVATLNSRINDLAQVAKEGRADNMPSAISEVNENVSKLAKTLKDNPLSDTETLKNIAISLKTLAHVPGADLTGNPEVKNLYQTVVESQISDLEKSTLTEEQADILSQAKELYEEGKYTDALEKILLINN